MVNLCLSNKNIDVNTEITVNTNYEVIKENALLFAIRKKSNKIVQHLLNHPTIDISAQYYRDSQGREIFCRILFLAIYI